MGRGEIAYWLAHKSADTLLIALTDGTLTWDNAAGEFDWSPVDATAAGAQGRLRGRAEEGRPRRLPRRCHAPGQAEFDERAADFAAAIRGRAKGGHPVRGIASAAKALLLAWSPPACCLRSPSWPVGRRKWPWPSATVLNDADRRNQHCRVDHHRHGEGIPQRTGLPADLTRKVLDRAEECCSSRRALGGDTPYLRGSRSVVLTELARTYLVLGDSEAASAAARRAPAMLEAVRHHGVATGPVDHR